MIPLVIVSTKRQETPVRYTLGQAAKETAKSKTTIQRAISKGILSAEKTKKGSYQIDPSELYRVFPKAHTETVAKPSKMDSSRPHDETPILRTKIDFLEQQLNDLREDRDAWKRQAMALLPAPPKRRRWWPW